MATPDYFQADTYEEEGATITTLPRAGGTKSISESLLNRDDLANLPSPMPMIDGTLDHNTVSVLAGYWGTYKSFIALDWAASIATGNPWMGRTVYAQPDPNDPTDDGAGCGSSVLYVAAEGAHGLHQRLNAWEADRGAKIPSGALSVLPRPVNLMNDIEVYELCETVGTDYDLVFVDTISKCIAGADENSAKDISKVVQNLYRIREASGGSVVAVHHTGKDKLTIRGSSALEGGVDTVYLTEGDGYNLRIRRTKRKDGPGEDMLNLKFSEVPGTGSGVLVSQSAMADANKAERAVLAAMDEMFAETGVSASDLMEVTGLPKSSFYRVRGDLLRDGVLEARNNRLFLVSPKPFGTTSPSESQAV